METDKDLRDRLKTAKAAVLDLEDSVKRFHESGVPNRKWRDIEIKIQSMKDRLYEIDCDFLGLLGKGPS